MKILGIIQLDPRTDPDWDRKYVPIARARVARFTCTIPQSASTASHNLHAKPRLPKSNHGTKLWASHNIFAGHYSFGFSKYGHILLNPM